MLNSRYALIHGDRGSVQEGYRRLCPPRVILQPAVERDMLLDVPLRGRAAPRRATPQPRGDHFFLTDQRQVMNVRKIPALDALLKLYGHPRAAQKHGPAGLGDVLADTQPRLPIVAIICRGLVELIAPEDVAFHYNQVPRFAGESKAGGRFTRATRARENKEGQSNKLMLILTVRTDCICPFGHDYFVSAIFPAVGADIKHHQPSIG